MKVRNLEIFVKFILVSQLAGIIGSLFTSPAINTWYRSLSKPVFNPPNWIFAPVWTSLFFLMGISAALIWNHKDVKERDVAIRVFFVQLLLNTMWSVIFFGLRKPLLSFIEIIVLWFAILYTIVLFWRIKRSAATLLIPYILWVSFAAVLNLSIVILN